MWIEYCAAVFGVKLYADKPFVFRQFNDFYQIGFGIDSGTDNAVFFVECFVFVIKFKTVAVAFADSFFAVNGFCSN